MSEVGDAIRELAHVVRTEEDIEGIALQVDDLWNRVQAHREATPAIETDTTTEVARVADALTDHPDWYIKGESTTERMVYGCQGCTVEVWTDESGSDGGDLTQPRAAFAKHQADLLAEAGLLREFPGRVDGAGGGETSNNSECSCARQVGAPVEHPQIVTETGPGAMQADSAGRGASGGLGERLRALVPAIYADDGYFGVTALEIREFADEADRLERDREGLRLRAELAESGLAMAARQKRAEREGS